MSDHKFDRLLSEIRNEAIEDRIVAEASRRVWNAISASPSAQLSMQKLRSCEDFQALVPAYLEKNLPEARRLLFQDHVRQCVECRHAVEQARAGAMQIVRRPAWQTDRQTDLPATASSSLSWRWAMGAAAVIIAGVATFALWGGFFPGQHIVRGSVQNVDGSLYAVVDDQVRLIPAGYEIRNGDEIRTAKGSNAVVRLLDGSLVEMGERSDLSVSRQWRGTTIRLDGGHIIVQAAKQRTGRLYVATDDCLVSVKGTIFSVNHGTKGSRVAVIEGVVRVSAGDHTTDLRAGDEQTSSSSLSKVPIQNEIAWSRDSAKYLALLGDFALLQKEFEAIPGPGLRYNSDLLPYVPDDTAVYAAIPNLASTLGEASQLFQDRLQQSPALRTWWNEQQRGNGPKLADLMDQLKTFSSYLGDEIVFAVPKAGSSYSAPIMLARVRQPGLEDFLQASMKHYSGTGPAPGSLQVVHDLSAVSQLANQSGNQSANHLSENHPFLVYVNNGVLVATPDVAELQRTVARIQESGASHFSETPLYQQVLHAYQQGAGWLFCADMEQIVAQHVQNGSDHQLPPGIADVRYLMLERREAGGKTENQAALTFASQRRGVASWLAAPASMGGLEFVSPDASMVSSLVIKNPKNIVQEMFQMIGSSDQNFQQDLAQFETKAGVRVVDDVAAPLGGEVTFAFDGPVLPTPRWKIILEVDDPVTLQSTIGKLVESFNREAGNSRGSLQLSQQRVGSQTYYTLHNSDQPNVEIYYTYVDSYLVAGPDISTLSRAIQNRQSGNSLTHSQTFQALLPSDGYTNFSAILYHNIGPVVGPLVEQIKAVGTLTPQQQQSIATLQANTAPGLIYAYGEPDRIVVASNSGFMGFDLGTLMTLGQGGTIPAQMFMGPTTMMTHPGSRHSSAGGSARSSAGGSTQ